MKKDCIMQKLLKMKSHLAAERVAFTLAEVLITLGIIGDVAVYSTSQTVKVDINGIKPPNTYGKDVFNFEVDFEKGVVRPTCAGCFESTVNNICKVNGNYCSAKIIRDGWKINYL